MALTDTVREPTVAAFGEWSETNIGDHAIHEGVQTFFGDSGWRVRSFDMGALRPSTGARPGVTSENNDARVRPLVALDTLPTAKRTLRGLRQRFLIKRLLPELARCDAICVGGGALLMDINLHFPQSLDALTWAARRLNKPLLCLGCSTESDWSPRGRQIVHDFLSSCRFVAVRDHASAARISNLLGRDVPIFGDFALHIKKGDQALRPWIAPRYVLAVNVTHVPAPYTASQQRYEDGLVTLVRDIMKQRPNGAVAIFTTGTAQDVAPATRVWRRLVSDGAELHLGHSLAQLRSVLRCCEAVVAARLHAAIISLAEELPVLGYAATPKVGNFFESIGLRSDYFGPNDPTAVVANRLSQLLSQHERLSASVAAPFDGARQCAREFLSTLTPVVYRKAANR